ncbi:MAG: hypothetical protein SFU27_11455 [Thermonemataceae bacterium]|nr:hypothetical protein [Thermonemataceae bacterium]
MNIQEILSKIFRSQKNRKQFLFAGVGFLLGFVLLVSSFYVYLQIRKTFSNNSELPDYMIISKQVTLINVLGASTFSQEDLAELQKQSFTEKLAVFRSGNFKVWAYGNDYLQFQTELFFEAIEKEMLANIPANWQWEKGEKVVPVIIPKDFVDQYNFVYAPSQGLPLISESLLATFPTLKARIYSKRGERNIELKIVGFEERIPSILVPESFMDWANQEIGTENKNPARIVLKVKNPASPELAKYLKDKNLQVNKEKTLLSQIAGQVVEVLGLVGFLGIAFVLLSLVIISMSFKLILSESKEEIRLLLQLGYTYQMIAQYLYKSFIKFIATYSLVGFGLVSGLIFLLYEYLQKRGVSHITLFEPLTLVLALGFIALVLLYNLLTIKKLVRKY